MDLRKMAKDFVLNEGKQAKPSVASYIQSIGDILESIRPSSKAEHNRLDVAKQHVREIRKHVRRLEEKVSLLEEELTILQESKEEE